MPYIEKRAERRPEIGRRSKPCTVTIIRNGLSTTKAHNIPVNGLSMAKAILRSRQRRQGETREERLLSRRERLVDAELKLNKLFRKRK